MSKKKKQNGTNRRLQLLILLILLIPLVIHNGIGEDVDKYFKSPEYYYLGASYDYKTSNATLKGEDVPLVSFPSLNVSINVDDSVPTGVPTIGFYLGNITTMNLETGYYYNGIIKDLYAPQNSQIQDLSELEFQVQIDPYELNTQYFLELDKTTLLLNSSEVSLNDILDYFGARSVFTATIENGSQFLPVLGPYQLDSYLEFRDEQQTKISELQQIVSNGSSSGEYINNWNYYGDLEKDTNISSSLDMAYEVNVTKETDQFFLSIYVKTYVFLVEQYVHYFSISEKISFVDKTTQASLNISREWSFNREPPKTIDDDSQSLPLSPISFYLSIIFIAAITSRLLKIKNKQAS